MILEIRRADDDRRFKILNLPHEFPLMFALHQSLQPDTCVMCHRFKTDDFPEGITLETVFYDHQTQTMAYVLYHPSWASVPLGERFPTIHSDQVQMEVFKYTNTTQKVSMGTAKSWRDLPSLLG